MKFDFCWVTRLGILLTLSAATVYSQSNGHLISLGDLKVSQVPAPMFLAGGATALGNGNWAYFAADDGEHGTEVWRWNGSGQAVLHADVRPGPESSHPAQFTAVGNMVIWVANDGVRGPEIRGSENLEPYHELYDLQPGASHEPPKILGAVRNTVWFTTDSWQGSQPTTVVWAMENFGHPQQVGVFARNSVQQASTVLEEEHLYFVARPLYTSAYALCRAYGTLNVQTFTDLDPAGSGLVPPAGSFAATPSFVCYRRISGDQAVRLLSFGSTSPVTLVEHAGPPTLPWFATNGRNRVCFTASTPQNGMEVWTTLGTPASTTLLGEVAAGPSSSNPSRLMMSPENQGVFFQVENGEARDLFFVDPGEKPAPVTRLVRAGVQTSTQFAIVDEDEIVLDVPGHHSTTLWLCDGSTGSAQQLGPTFSAVARIWNPSAQVPPERRLNVVATEDTTGEELYRLNGTASLALLSLNSLPGASASPRGFFRWTTEEIFVADRPDAVGRLFTVGASGGPGTIYHATPPDVNPANASSHPAEFTELGSMLLFTAHDGSSRRLCVCEDGKAASATPVDGIYEPEQLVQFQGRVFMLGRAAAHHTGGKKVYMAQVKNSSVEVTAFDTPPHSASALIAAAGRLFFVEPADNNAELLQNVMPDFHLGTSLTYYRDTAGVGITQLTASSGHLYFSGLVDAPASGGQRMIWSTDGTTAGTRRPNAPILNPQLLGALGDACVFWAAASSDPWYEAFVWDGDAGGDLLYQGNGPLAEAPERSRVAGKPAGVEYEGRFYLVDRRGFLLSTNGQGMEVRFSSGQRRVWAESLAVINGKLVFMITDQNNNAELLTFTELEGVRSVFRLPGQTLPCPLVGVQGRLYFTVCHLENAFHPTTDLWSTNGTEEGTRLEVPRAVERQAAFLPMGFFRGHLVLASDYHGGRGFEPALLNHSPEVPLPPVLAGARRGQSFTFTYEQVVAGPATDANGDTLNPLRIFVHEGSLKQNGSFVETSTEIAPGDTFEWVQGSLSRGVVQPFQLYTSDAWQEGSAPVMIKVDAPLDVWAQGHFTAEELADPAIGGEEADADGDGVANALEFVFGRHPRTHNKEPACTPSVAEAQGGGRVVRFTFVRTAVLAEGTVLTVESSLDLTPDSWAEVATKNQSEPWTGAGTVTETTLPDGRVQVVVEIPAAGDGRGFMRLSAGL